MNRCCFFDINGYLLIRSDHTLPQLPDDLPDAFLLRAHAFSSNEYVLRVTDADAAALQPLGLTPYPLRATWRKLSDAEYQHAGKAWELLYWSEQTRHCSVCGAPMQWHTGISRCCTACQREVWPQLNIAIIVLVHRRDEALLVKARSFRRDFYGLVAGFVETGESLEECVAREVWEETRLHINNIRYFGSQPWPYPLGLMVGFHADYVSGDIRFADGELSEGAFFRHDALPRHVDGTPAIPGTESMARQLINDWISHNH